jgi:hypothetical protein
MALRSATRRRPLRPERRQTDRMRRIAEDYRPRDVPGYNAAYEEPPQYVGGRSNGMEDDDPRVERRRGLNRLGQNVKQLCESIGVEETANRLGHLLQTGQVKHTQFSIRELAEAFCGSDWVHRLNPRFNGGFSTRSLMEAGQGIDVSAFSNIVGQIYYTRIAEGWKNATLVAERLFERQPTDFDGEKIPWLSHVIQEGQPIQPNMPYPEANFGERFVQTPYTQKWGLIVSVTKEMIFFDRTGQVTRAAYETGYKLGYNKEKRCLVVFLGMVNSYSLNGTTYNTYNTGTNLPPSYTNAATGVPLVDYSSLQVPLTLFSQILDPDTLNPLDTPECKNIFVMPGRLLHARRVVGATEYVTVYPQYATASGSNPPYAGTGNEPYGNVMLHGKNPWMEGAIDIITSPIAYQLVTGGGNYNTYAPAWTGRTPSQANEWWFVGDFKRSFWYMENWPITTVQAPPNNIREFEQDIVLRWKSSERGTPAIFDPRYTCFLSNT